MYGIALCVQGRYRSMLFAREVLYYVIMLCADEMLDYVIVWCAGGAVLCHTVVYREGAVLSLRTGGFCIVIMYREGAVLSLCTGRVLYCHVQGGCCIMSFCCVQGGWCIMLFCTGRVLYYIILLCTRRLLYYVIMCREGAVWCYYAAGVLYVMYRGWVGAVLSLLHAGACCIMSLLCDVQGGCCITHGGGGDGSPCGRRQRLGGGHAAGRGGLWGRGLGELSPPPTLPLPPLLSPSLTSSHYPPPPPPPHSSCCKYCTHRCCSCFFAGGLFCAQTCTAVFG